MKNVRKLFAILLVLALLAATPMALAAEPTVYTDNYFQYTLENQSITIVNYYGPDEEVTVPASIGGYPVNTIASGTFAGCPDVTKINLPDCIMTIEEGAFNGEQTVVFDSNTPEPIVREPSFPEDEVHEIEEVPSTSNGTATESTMSSGNVQTTDAQGNPLPTETDTQGNVVTPATDAQGNAVTAPAGQQNQPESGTKGKSSSLVWIWVIIATCVVVIPVAASYPVWSKKLGKKGEEESNGKK